MSNQKCEPLVSDVTADAYLLTQALDQHSIVSIADTNGKIIHVNERFCEISGYSGYEVMNGNCQLINSEDVSPELFEEIWQTIANGKTWHGELENRTKEGHPYWLQTTIVPCLNEKGNPYQYISIRTDITKQKQIEDELRLANEKANKLNRKLQIQASEFAMESAKHQMTSVELVKAKVDAERANKLKLDFLSHMSHELRTPLNAIIGFSQIWMDEVFGRIENTKYMEYAEGINYASTHLLEIISDILEFSKNEAGDMQLDLEAVEPEDVLKSCISMLQPRVTSSEVDVGYSISPEISTLNVDRRLLNQVLINIVDNGLKFTPSGGQVHIDVKPLESGATLFTVSDNGVGIAHESLDLAMEPFGQVRNSSHVSHEGTGLGLPLAKQMVDLHGGTLAIMSEIGKGTTVKIIFPADPVVHALQANGMI